MSSILPDCKNQRIANQIDKDELLRNLNRFPPSVLPIGLLRELQSQGDAVHDSIVKLIVDRIESRGTGIGRRSDSVFFALALLIPISSSDDRAFVESLFSLSEMELDELFGEITMYGLPFMVANLLKGSSSSEWIDWIHRISDQLDRYCYLSGYLFNSMSIAVQKGDIDRLTAIEALVNRLKSRSEHRHDIQSSMAVDELIKLSAQKIEGVDAVVRASFERQQIDDDFVSLQNWSDSSKQDKPPTEQIGWTDTALELSQWCYDYLTDDLDPVDATYRLNPSASGRHDIDTAPDTTSIAELRKSSDSYYPKSAVHLLSENFPNSYHAVVDLIREEVARYKDCSDSWSGNGVYLGLILTIASEMPLPRDLLETILGMEQSDRERLFGDQFGLIVSAVALTPMPDYEFLESWIWNPENSKPDRREMVDAYLQACDNGYLDRQWTVDTLASGLRRALQDESTLIAPYAESLAFLSPKEHVGLLEEATAREDVDWFLLLEDLRRMAKDAEFAARLFAEYKYRSRDIQEIISKGVMFDLDAIRDEIPLPRSVTAKVLPTPEVYSTQTLRKEERPQRNSPCPCGSGKKYKKCCLRNGNI